MKNSLKFLCLFCLVFFYDGAFGKPLDSTTNSPIVNINEESTPTIIEDISDADPELYDKILEKLNPEQIEQIDALAESVNGNPEEARSLLALFSLLFSSINGANGLTPSPAGSGLLPISPSPSGPSPSGPSPSGLPTSGSSLFGPTPLGPSPLGLSLYGPSPSGPSPSGSSPSGLSTSGSSPFGPTPLGPSPLGLSLYGPSFSGPSPSGPSPSGPSPSGPSPSGLPTSGSSLFGPAPSGPSPSGPSPYGLAPTGPSPSSPSPSGTSFSGSSPSSLFGASLTSLGSTLGLTQVGPSISQGLNHGLGGLGVLYTTQVLGVNELGLTPAASNGVPQTDGNYTYGKVGEATGLTQFGGGLNETLKKIFSGLSLDEITKLFGISQVQVQSPGYAG